MPSEATGFRLGINYWPARSAMAMWNDLDTTETGAGQWGSALCFATQLFDLKCKVFMVTISYHQKPYRRIMMETWGASCVASPSTLTKAGQQMLDANPDKSLRDGKRHQPLGRLPRNAEGGGDLDRGRANAG